VYQRLFVPGDDTMTKAARNPEEQQAAYGHAFRQIDCAWKGINIEFHFPA